MCGMGTKRRLRKWLAEHPPDPREARGEPLEAESSEHSEEHAV